ncbi:GNAT family N-acetyltransferase [Geodermatophilus sp. SYSU D00742]
MHITVVRPGELGEAEIDLWREFQRATPALQNAFLSPEFSVVVGRHRPQARVAVLSDGPRIVGFFPFERGRLGRGSPIATNLTGCQGLVHAPGAEWDTDQLLRGCGLAVYEFDSLVDGQEPFRPYEAIRVPSPIMDLSRGWAAYLAEQRQRSQATFKKLPQRARKLGREVGEVRFLHDTADRATLRTLMSWKSEQYRRTGRSDRFTWPGVPEILDELLDTRTVTFSAVLSEFRAGETLAGVTLVLRSHSSASGWFAGYNVELARYSVGMQAQLGVAEALAGEGVHELHMGRGTRDAYKQTLKSRDLVVAEGRLLRRTPAGALHWAKAAPARRIRYLVTESPRLLRAADRTLYRYGELRTSLGRRTDRSRTTAAAR